jgi:hypothetical protein
MPRQTRTMSTRLLLKAYQRLQQEDATGNLARDLDLLQAKDLDLSVRLGALLAFDALLVTVALNPISASPGAPLSLDAPTQPIAVALTTVAVTILAAAAYLCVRAIMIGEEFSDEGIENNPQAIIQRMFAAYCTSIDAQRKLLGRASWLTISGGTLTGLTSIWIMAAKIWG